MDSLQVVRAFVDAINVHDVDAILSLTAPDHRLVDSLGNVLAPEMLSSAWQGYFAMVPDYRIDVTHWLEDEEMLLAAGKASGTLSVANTIKPENFWSTPAAWRAVVRDGKVAEWQVYADNEPIRRIMRLNGADV